MIFASSAMPLPVTAIPSFKPFTEFTVTIRIPLVTVPPAETPKKLSPICSVPPFTVITPENALKTPAP